MSFVLVNRFFCSFQVAHELLALQLLTVLLEEPTDDSVEIAVNFTKEIGQVRYFFGAGTHRVIGDMTQE